MHFIDSIVLREDPPSGYKVPGALWQEDGRVMYKEHSTNTTRILANWEELIISHTYVSDVAKEVHIIEHNLETKSLLWSFQDDLSGEPNEYLLATVIPTPGNTLNSVTVIADEEVKLHATLMKAGL